MNTGAIDDLNRLADICAAESIWLHVDGAFGALASLSPSRRQLLEGLTRLHESGAAVPSYTTLAGRYVLRVAITNHRSRREDFDLLVEEVVRLGRELKDKMVCERSREDEIPACRFGSPS